ncbi:MDR family MFS transporter [Anaeromyxobacter oryzae]|uniref:MDR family MFS transporter n=1 Tax=Anaeromyxobacter oryzae TaxID=2918170 RepID=UPI0020C13F59|nr:MFS transporter [Anaeromyxobacter oryzae]
MGGLPPVFWTLWTGMLLNRLASFVATFLALYLTQERGFTIAEAGRVVALYGVGITVAGPIGGSLADRVGRRFTMLLGLVLGSASVAALGFTRDPTALAFLAFLAAATGELYRPAVNAAVADVVPPADRRRAFGLIYWAVNLGWALGLAFAGVVAQRSIVALFLLDAATTLAFAFVIVARVPETRPAGLPRHPPLEGLLRVFKDGPYVAFLFLNLAALVVFTQFQLAAPLDMAAHGVGPSTFSFLMALNGVGVVLLQPTLAPQLRRFDGAHLLAASVLLFGLGFGVNALGGSLPLYVLGVVLWTVGEVVGFPVASALVSDLAPPELRGRYQGAFSMTWGLAFTLSPIFGGELLERFGGPTLWLSCLGVGGAVAIGHLLAAPPRRRRLAALGVAAPDEAEASGAAAPEA